MHHAGDVADATRSVEQALAKLGLLALTNGLSGGDLAARLSAATPVSVSNPSQADGMTFRPDQIKVRGAGRRPATLVGREVTVVAAWTVVAQHDDGSVTAALVGAPAKATGGRGKKRVKA